jgi:hypothetical protein
MKSMRAQASACAIGTQPFVSRALSARVPDARTKKCIVLRHGPVQIARCGARRHPARDRPRTSLTEPSGTDPDQRPQAFEHARADAADGAQVVLTEEATVPNPIFRLLVKIAGPTKYLDEHLVDLAQHFGETAVPR